MDTTDEAWNDFYMAWLQYKDEYALVGQGVTRQLYTCCTTELATSLSRTTGGALHPDRGTVGGAHESPCRQVPEPSCPRSRAPGAVSTD